MTLLSMSAVDELITVGRFGSVYGVRGWVRVQSFTTPPEKILDYQPWWVAFGHQGKRQQEARQDPVQIEIEASQLQAKGLVVKIVGLDDREQAKAWSGREIQVDAALLPPLEDGEYYWHQLLGMAVKTSARGSLERLGRVRSFLETGANDVLVVQGDADSLDQRERLIPYLPERTIRSIDMDAAEIVVDWDPDF